MPSWGGPARAWAAALRFLVALLLAALFGVAHAEGKVVDAASLPPEARHTLFLIDAGGPFPHKRDGVVFGNYEQRLPARARGYYREYAVPTPGAKNRGARRIVAGAGGERYYSDNHYRTFHRIRE